MVGHGKSDDSASQIPPEPSAEYLAAFAHELRNPLAPIRNSAELLRSLCTDQRQLTAVETIVRQVVRLTRMLDDVVDAAQLRRGLVSLKKQSVDIGAIADHALEAVRPSIDARRQSLLVSLPSHAVQMLCDPARLVQVLQNLLDNASRYTAEGGAISLEIAVHDQQLVMEVADNGAGIARDELPTLFNVYAHPRPPAKRKGGLGLGLVIARNLVEMHGGVITADSGGVGQGSRFTMKLPLESVEFEAASRPVPDEAAHRVLIIDDEPDSGVSLASFLSAKGYVVATARSGEAGVAAARAFKPHAVVIDIGLPGMDGFDVAQALRSMPEVAGALLIAVSGYSLKTFRPAEAYAVFRHYLLKPTNPGTIAAIIARSLASGDAS
jgi:CheY-like chemotaxis protein/two-component sensor histidine kinase